MNLDFSVIFTGINTAFCMILYSDLLAMTKRLNKIETLLVHININRHWPSDPSCTENITNHAD